MFNSKVWASNFQAEFILFSHTLRFAGAGAVVAIDTEFPGVLQENSWKESDASAHYEAMKDCCGFQSSTKTDSTDVYNWDHQPCGFCIL